MGRVAAVVLAAGEATRFGSPKQRLLLPDVLRALERAPVDEVVIVEGAYALEPAAGARVVRCHEWAVGAGASLRCGLAALGQDVAAAVVVLADGPRLAPEAVSRVLEEWRRTGEPVVAASYGGVRGHPLVVARDRWEGVPDEGLRGWEPMLVRCDDLGDPGDIDTPADLEAL
jgi:nicotine blue oxidoreductase